MRPMIMDFAADKKTHDIGNEYLFGRSVPVSPITKPDVAAWRCIFLQGQTGEFLDREKIGGGKTIDREVPKDIKPMYIKTVNYVLLSPKKKVWKPGLLLKPLLTMAKCNL
jgi:alpha-D-xyloside xylohydrolase